MTTDSVSLDRLYQETWSQIRATDDISFKLIGLVPLVSGASLLTLFLKEPIPAAKAGIMLGLAVYAALITLGLFRWELRNMQTCSWLLRRAEALERELIAMRAISVRPSPPTRIGKAEAEKWIYSLTIVAWLAVPPLVSEPVSSPGLLAAYLIAATLVLAATAASIFANVRVAKIDAPPK